MSWIEREFCHVWSGDSASEQDVVDDACFQLNFWKHVVQEFFAARGEDGASYLRHIDGRTKTHIRVNTIPDQYLGRLGRPTLAGSGLLLLSQQVVHCCRNIYNGTIPSFTDHSTVVPFTMADRYWALLELSAIILHEQNHVVWRFGEQRAWCMEGFFRQRVQAELGIAEMPLCGQLFWTCGACVGNAPGCGSVSDLAGHMHDITNWPLIPACGVI